MTAQQGLFNIYQVRFIFGGRKKMGQNGVASVKYKHLNKSYMTAHKQRVTKLLSLVKISELIGIVQK